jgi:hypothetical protein
MQRFGRTHSPSSGLKMGRGDMYIGSEEGQTCPYVTDRGMKYEFSNTKTNKESK